MNLVKWRSDNVEQQPSCLMIKIKLNSKDSDEICGLKKVIVMTINEVDRPLNIKNK